MASVIAGSVLWLAGLAGCETVSADLGDLARSLTPRTPSEVARMAADMNDPDARREGIVLLSNAPFGGADAYVALYREYAANDPDPIVRAIAVRALARHGGPEDAPIIAANLDHENVQVRWEAAKGLQRLHNPEVVAAMLAVIRDESREADVRMAIADGLGQYPQDRVFQALIAALDAPELGVNRAAERSLQTLTGQALGFDARAWLRWYNQVGGAAGTAFAQQQEYLFPTFDRDESLLEKLAFWSTTRFEQPGVPAGLRPSDERRTYEDEPAPTEEQDG